ncbi:MAG: TonB-dependent receptor [Acidobacteria bacterium]|nr:TonB-dependent receptor [Acidobacteriota bacterium]
MFLLLPATAWSQSGAGNGAIEGVVVDPERRPVPGASVSIRADDTGEIRRTLTDERGRFSALAMPVGAYTIEATLEGFAPSRRAGIIVRVGHAEVVNLQLAIAGITQSVSVDARAPLDTSGAATAARIDLKLIDGLPVRGRNFAEFVLLTPAVAQESDRSGLVIGGQRSINANLALDGADFNDPLVGNQRGGNESSFFFPQAAVREFQVVRSGAGAEVGRTSTGFVNVVTRSGANDVRGEAFYLNRNRHLTSANAFNEKLDNQQNQFGGAIGGPVVKDRAFYFGAFEQNFLRVPFVVKFQEQAPGVVVPAELKALEGEKFGTDNPTALFSRLDWRISDGHRLDLQYTFSRLAGKNSNFASPQVDAAEEANFSRRVTSHAVKVGVVTVVSPVMVNEVRMQFARDDRAENPNVNRPGIVIGGFGSIGADFDRPRFFEAHRFQVSDNLTAIRGRHELRGGLDVNITPSRQQQEGRILGRYDFTSLANYKAGIVSRYRQTLPSTNPDEQYYEATQRELALFVQDRVALSSQVTLTAGLRWEGQWNPQPPRPNPAIVETSRIPNDLGMWQPRLGLAWDVAGAGHTLVRLSAGLYNARTPANLFQRVFTDNGITTVAVDSRTDSSIYNYLVYPNGLVTLPPGVRVPPQRVFGFAADFQNPDTTALSATVERRLTEGLQVSVGVVRNRTTHLQRRVDRNLFAPTITSTGLPVFPSARPNPTIAALDVNESTARSEYDALVFTANGRSGTRVQWEMSYTFARNWDDDSNERSISRQMTLNSFDLDSEWAPSKNDVRHSFVGSAVADLPAGLTLSTVLITRSGVPYTAVIGSDQQRDGNDNNDRAIIDGRMVGRNTFRQPAFFNLDVRLAKTLRVRGLPELQLLVDLLNATRASNKNLANDGVSVYGTPEEPVATAGQMLYAPSTARFGGPRQLQLGIKVLF